jgi:peptidoglycan hydrolase-like protein with peptidoglycan-binding domain
VLALSGKTLPIAILPPQQQKPPPPPVTPLGTGGGGLFYTLVNQNPIHEGTVLGTSTESIASMTTPLAAETATSSKSSYLFTQNLQYGMSDDAVFKLQEKLIAHGMLSIIIPTGWFGPLTLKAVKIFQEQNEIPPTGFVGAMTRASLNAWK